MSRQNFKKKDGIKLPFALRKELGLGDEGDRGQGSRRHGGSRAVDRKERRRTMRVEKRRGGSQTKHSQHRVPKDTYKNDTLEEEDEDEDETVSLPVVKQEKTTSRKPKEKSYLVEPRSVLKKARARQPSPVKSESDASRASSPGLVLDPSSRSFKQRAEEDDAEIAALERRLGLKGKSGSKLGDEMLDFVLEGLDDGEESKKRKREGQDWLDQKRRKTVRSNKDESGSGSDSEDISGLEDSGDEDSMGNEELLGLDEDEEDIAGENVVDGSEGDELDEVMNDDDNFGGFESDGNQSVSPPPVKKVRENPYVAPIAPGTTPGKYIPPSLRKPMDENSSSLGVLKRQTQGQLNKLSEANMTSILGEIEKLYRTNPRQDVTTVLIDLIMTSFCIRSALQNTYVILHAAFLAAVYKVMGTDFGAELVVKLVERFDQVHQNPEVGKEALNLIGLFANLFTFSVVGSSLVYDHIRLLLQNFNETNAELLLRVVRDCGPQLRSDDPSALKSIVQMMQEISAEMTKNGQTMNIRTRVMMDTITDLKNNKMKNATNAAGLTGEHITRMKKALGSLNNRALKATEPLRITRIDIANSDKKGKWWLVGASWKGNEPEQDKKKELGDSDQIQEGDSIYREEDVDLLALAKQYRMNTDVRRSIFVAIMSANDCRDAQTRLLKLRLSTKQEQEIAKVLLRCARAEPAYNPYYALLAKNLCKENKKVRIGFQYGLWDFFGRMGEKADGESDDEGDSSMIEMHEIINIARMYAYLIFHGHLPIGVLKTLNIGFQKEQATMFLEILLISIMTQPKAGEEELIRVFSKAAETPQIVKSLQYFVKKNVRKSDLISKKEKERVKEGCRTIDLALNME